MANRTSIEWTDMTWNPVTGCTKISRGCDNCYAERFSERFRGTPDHPFKQGFDLKLWPDRLSQPARWKHPQRVFVNSMSDLFHKEIPTSFIDRVFDAMEAVPQHTFQILTKRSSLMRDYINARYGDEAGPRHIWMGVSVEDRAALSRVEHLRQARAGVRFLSVEPLLAAIGTMNLSGLHWVIVGGESGPGFRAMHPDWAREVRDQCLQANVPFFFKQWGGFRPKAQGRELDGRVWDEFPADSALQTA